MTLAYRDIFKLKYASSQKSLYALKITNSTLLFVVSMVPGPAFKRVGISRCFVAFARFGFEIYAQGVFSPTGHGRRAEISGRCYQ